MKNKLQHEIWGGSTKSILREFGALNTYSINAYW